MAGKSSYVEEGTTFKTTWSKGLDGSFNDIKKEKFATELALGKAIAEAAKTAELSYSVALQWAKHDDLRARKIELRANPAVSQTYTVSVAMILAELHLNATEARKVADFKSSNEALKSIYQIAKSEKSLLETFDAKSATQSKNVVAALRAHLEKVHELPEEATGEDA